MQCILLFCHLQAKLWFQLKDNRQSHDDFRYTLLLVGQDLPVLSAQFTLHHAFGIIIQISTFDKEYHTLLNI